MSFKVIRITEDKIYLGDEQGSFTIVPKDDLSYDELKIGDMVDYLPTWHRVDELVHEVQFVGDERPGYEKETPYPVLWITAPKMDISSTQIRKNVLFQQSIKYLVPELVEAYIAEKGLYLE